ncbi:MAG TPA: RDD family protein [Solimonas sp.]|nr:RDD family protein [Solimonas sp.]
MSPLPVSPAPLGRRLAAAIYDGLLLLALWMVALLVDVVLRDLLGLSREWHALRAYVFLIGLVFFGWFWTHGGQTLGMRAWRLRLRTSTDRDIGWLAALGRYAAMIVCWGVVLAPAFLRLPRLAQWPSAPMVSVCALALVAVTLLAWYLDGRRRMPQDWISGSEMVLLPKP